MTERTFKEPNFDNPTMDREWVLSQLVEIIHRDKQEDWEASHSLEDDLCHQVLYWIAKGHPLSIWLARECLMTLQKDKPRHCG